MKHYQTPETSVLQVENCQQLCAGSTLVKLNSLQNAGSFSSTWAGWDKGE